MKVIFLFNFFCTKFYQPNHKQTELLQSIRFKWAPPIPFFLQFFSSWSFGFWGTIHFWFKGRGGGGGPMGQVLFRRGRSVHSLSILSFWNARFQKFNNFAGAAFIFNIHIFRFKADAGFQVDINFNTESKFSFSRSSKPNP